MAGWNFAAICGTLEMIGVFRTYEVGLLKGSAFTRRSQEPPAGRLREGGSPFDAPELGRLLSYLRIPTVGSAVKSGVQQSIVRGGVPAKANSHCCLVPGRCRRQASGVSSLCGVRSQ